MSLQLAKALYPSLSELVRLCNIPPDSWRKVTVTFRPSADGSMIIHGLEILLAALPPETAIQVNNAQQQQQH
jgi:hypothetical protein